MTDISDKTVRNILEQQSTTYSRTRVIRKKQTIFRHQFLIKSPSSSLVREPTRLKYIQKSRAIEPIQLYVNLRRQF